MAGRPLDGSITAPEGPGILSQVGRQGGREGGRGKDGLRVHIMYAHVHVGECYSRLLPVGGAYFIHCYGFSNYSYLSETWLSAETTPTSANEATPTSPDEPITYTKLISVSLLATTFCKCTIIIVPGVTTLAYCLSLQPSFKLLVYLKYVQCMFLGVTDNQLES